MGRYSSVQAFADNNANMRAVDYSQAAGSDAPKLSGPGMLCMLDELFCRHDGVTYYF